MDLPTYVQETLHKFHEAHELDMKEIYDHTPQAYDASADVDSDDEVGCEGSFHPYDDDGIMLFANIQSTDRGEFQYLHKFALHVHARDEELLDQAIKCLMACELLWSRDGDWDAQLDNLPVFIGVMFARLLEGMPAAAPLQLEEDFLLNSDDVPAWSWASPFDPYYSKCGVKGIAPRNDASRQRLQTPHGTDAACCVAARVPCLANYVHLFAGFTEWDMVWRLSAMPGTCDMFEDLKRMIATREVTVTVRAHERHSVAGEEHPSYRLESDFVMDTTYMNDDSLCFTSPWFAEFTMLVVWLTTEADGVLPTIERVVVKSDSGATVVDQPSTNLPQYSDERISAVFVPASERALLSRVNFFEDVLFVPYCTTVMNSWPVDDAHYVFTVWFDTLPTGCVLHCHSFL